MVLSPFRKKNVFILYFLLLLFFKDIKSHFLLFCFFRLLLLIFLFIFRFIVLIFIDNCFFAKYVSLILTFWFV